MTNIITAVTMNYFLMPRYMFFEVMKNFDSFFDDFAGPQLLLMMISWLRNGRSYKQLDYCGHHVISCLSRSGVFVEKNQKGVTFCKWGDFLLCGGTHHSPLSHTNTPHDPFPPTLTLSPPFTPMATTTSCRP